MVIDKIGQIETMLNNSELIPNAYMNIKTVRLIKVQLTMAMNALREGDTVSGDKFLGEAKHTLNKMAIGCYCGAFIRNAKRRRNKEFAQMKLDYVVDTIIKDKGVYYE